MTGRASDLPCRLAASRSARGAGDDHRRRPDPLRAARGRRHPRSGAVLMLFGEGADGPDLLLTERAHDMRSHPGPGVLPRRLDRPGDDAVAEAAALREAEEETGLDPAGVEVFASCPSCGCRRATSRSRRCWAGGARRARSASVDPAEVHAVYRVPIARAARPGAPDLGAAPVAAGSGPAFLIGDDKDLILWGFTAGIIARLFDFLGWTRPWDADRDARPARPHAAADPPRAGVPTARPRASRSDRVNLLDWVLVVLVLAYAVSGYWQGFITGAFATGGPAARRPVRRLAGAARARRRRPVALGLAGGAVRRARLRLARPGAAASTSARGSATGSPGSRSGPSTRSAAPR